MNTFERGRLHHRRQKKAWLDLRIGHGVGGGDGNKYTRLARTAGAAESRSIQAQKLQASNIQSLAGETAALESPTIVIDRKQIDDGLVYLGGIITSSSTKISAEQALLRITDSGKKSLCTRILGVMTQVREAYRSLAELESIEVVEPGTPSEHLKPVFRDPQEPSK
jgi:hypothetical protein